MKKMKKKVTTQFPMSSLDNVCDNTYCCFLTKAFKMYNGTCAIGANTTAKYLPISLSFTWKCAMYITITFSFFKDFLDGNNK